LYGPDHLIHWIHFNHSMGEPSEVIPVAAAVDDDGLVHIEGDDVSLLRWNHRPALLRDAPHGFGGVTVSNPRGHISAVPTESSFAGARTPLRIAPRYALGDLGRMANCAINIRLRSHAGIAEEPDETHQR
jgi:hypothetical protein